MWGSTQEIYSRKKIPVVCPSASSCLGSAADASHIRSVDWITFDAHIFIKTHTQFDNTCINAVLRLSCSKCEIIIFESRFEILIYYPFRKSVIFYPNVRVSPTPYASSVQDGVLYFLKWFHKDRSREVSAMIFKSNHCLRAKQLCRSSTFGCMVCVYDLREIKVHMNYKWNYTIRGFSHHRLRTQTMTPKS